ncbi:hypothetical protein [Deinococcus roseus]|uniref:Uncharacterized protein n=1 Tax=Deinococcus roseus TaxID=392414 RepID=A0ABQ2CYZ3_9DEIO|nr:hypothetical protein [Deinococcus roseus]GGJ28261.1 hypothetical protein GCM10008938_12910 [Deinococcus roseus]
MLFILSLIAGLIIGSSFLIVVLLMDRSLKTPQLNFDDLQDAPPFSLNPSA